MTTNETAKPKGKLLPKGWKGVGILFVVGGAVGYLVGSLIAKAGIEIDTRAMEALGTSGVIALSIGAIYIILGLVLLVALAAPKYGQNMLTGPDAQDLEDAKPLYFLQSVATLFMGGALIVLSLSGPGLWLTSTVGGLAFLAMMIAGIGLWVRSLPMMDELVRAASMDSVAWTYGFLLVIGGGWAAMAHLGIVAGPAMLDWLSLFWALSLVGSMIAATRRGMLDEA